jgi:hypothetical protein
MQSTSGLPKDAANHIPWFKDQGIPNPVGCPKRGLSMFSFTVAMPGGGVIALPYKMANGLYQIVIQNHTDPADEATVAYADRKVQQITVVGPDAADVLDIVIFGQLDGQLDT